MARPTGYTVIKENLAQIKEWKKLGATDEQVCQQLNIGKSTFYKYKAKNKEFAEALKIGVQDFVANLKGELAGLATKHTLETKKQYIKVDQETGHKTQYTEITTKEIDANIGAIHLLLKNLDRDNWSNDWQNHELKKQELELRKKIADDKEWT